MNPAKLDRKLVILKRDYARTPSGSAVEQWLQFATPYAQKIDAKGAEVLASLAVKSVVTYVFRIRYVANLTKEEFRVVYEGQTLAFVHIEPEGRNQTQLIFCEAVTKKK